MIMPDITPEIAGQVSVEGSQSVQNAPVNAGSGAAQPVQTQQENAAFADMRRRLEAAESKANKVEKDHAIAKKYGTDYGVYSEEDIAERYGTQYGITTLEQLDAAIERETQRVQSQQAGIDPDVIDKLLEKKLSNNPVIKQTQDYFTKARIAEEKTAIKDMKFYKELEPEIDKILKANSRLSVKEVYTYLKGEKADELYEKASKTAAGQAVENHINQAKRGVESADVPPVDEKTLEFTAEEKAHGERMVKNGHYKNLAEYYSYLHGKSGVKMR
jgi:hypothetical protein